MIYPKFGGWKSYAVLLQVCTFTISWSLSVLQHEMITNVRTQGWKPVRTNGGSMHQSRFSGWQELVTSTLSSIWLQVEQGFDPTALWLQSALVGGQDIADQLPVVSRRHYSAMLSLPPPIIPEVLPKWALLLISPLHKEEETPCVFAHALAENAK